MSSLHPQWSIERVGGLMSALILAGLVNLLILMLIDTLVAHRSMLAPPVHAPHPIRFVRTVPKPPREEPQKVVTSIAPAVVEPQTGNRPGGSAGAPEAGASHRKPATAQRKAKAKSPPQPAPRSIRSVRDRSAPAVPAPRIEVPSDGTGVPLAPSAGSTPHVAGPPAHWKPGPGGRGGRGPGTGSGGQGGTGSGGAGTSGVAVLSRVLPRYPESARSSRIQGWVSLEITISRTGSVSAARVVEASPKQIFDQAALQAIRQWKFKPAYRQGEPVEQTVRQKIVFRLDRS